MPDEILENPNIREAKRIRSECVQRLADMRNIFRLGSEILPHYLQRKRYEEFTGVCEFETDMLERNTNLLNDVISGYNGETTKLEKTIQLVRNMLIDVDREMHPIKLNKTVPILQKIFPNLTEIEKEETCKLSENILEMLENYFHLPRVSDDPLVRSSLIDKHWSKINGEKSIKEKFKPFI